MSEHGPLSSEAVLMARLDGDMKALRDVMQAGFQELARRMDTQRAEYREQRSEMAARIVGLSQKVGGIEERLRQVELAAATSKGKWSTIIALISGGGVVGAGAGVGLVKLLGGP